MVTHLFKKSKKILITTETRETLILTRFGGTSFNIQDIDLAPTDESDSTTTIDDKKSADSSNNSHFVKRIK
jgi:hypothetical protein